MPVMFVHAMCSPLAGHAFGNTCIGFTRSTSCIYQQNQNNDISVFGCDSVMAIYMRCQGSRDWYTILDLLWCCLFVFGCVADCVICARVWLMVCLCLAYLLFVLYICVSMWLCLFVCLYDCQADDWCGVLFVLFSWICVCCLLGYWYLCCVMCCSLCVLVGWQPSQCPFVCVIDWVWLLDGLFVCKIAWVTVGLYFCIVYYMCVLFCCAPGCLCVCLCTRWCVVCMYVLCGVDWLIF